MNDYFYINTLTFPTCCLYILCVSLTHRGPPHIPGATPGFPVATQSPSPPNEILWKVILYHPLTVHWTVKPPHWKQNKRIGEGERGGWVRRRIIILCRPLVLTQTPELSAVQRGRCEGQTFSVNWHFVSSEPSFCEGRGRESERERGRLSGSGGRGRERMRERERARERESLFL